MHGLWEKETDGQPIGFIRKKSEKVAVVGAGMVGLCTALELGMRGYAVTLLEQHSQLGGRCCSCRQSSYRQKTWKRPEKAGAVGNCGANRLSGRRNEIDCALQQYDAIYVSAAVLTEFQTKYSIDRQTLQNQCRKVFAGNTTPETRSFIADAYDAKRLLSP